MGSIMISRSMFCLLILLLSLLVGGCSEERYGSLYCPSGPADTLVVFPRLEFQQVMVISDTTATADQGPGMAGMESLYLGSSGETRSDILVNFDFSDVISEDYPDSFFEVDNIRFVKLVLKRLIPYTATEDSLTTTGIIYNVKALDQPFDSEQYTTWPGPAPSIDDRILNSDFTELNYSNEPYLRLYPEDLSGWVLNRETVGMVITAAEGSDEGLVGFASRELTRYHELPPLYAGSSVAPTIIVQFDDLPIYDQFFQIPPRNDTSSFESVTSLPPEMVHVQTGLRSYPVLTFDIPPLSDRTCVFDIRLRILEDELDPLLMETGLAMYYLDASSSEWSNGPVLEEDLSAAATRYSSYYYILPYPMPEVVRMMFNWRLNFAPLWYSSPASARSDRPTLPYSPSRTFLGNEATISS